MSAPARPAGGQSRSRSGELLAQLSAPVRRFVRTEAASAGLLVLATLVALVWANSPWGASYDELWHTEFTVRLGSAEISEDLQHWVNDGLMVFFFFLVGMEVRRELSMGELTQRSRLTVPTVAAIAGLVVPAVVYLAINAGGDGARGWGVAMATDTAFVLGALALIGPACPTQLRVFLLSLSVVDDIGALSAIAIFYTEDLSLPALAVAGVCVAVFLLLGRLRVWRGPAYFAVGVVLWVAMYESGVHTTIGGVVVGLLISAYPPRRDEVERAGALARAFRQSPQPSLAREAKLSVERAVSPNERIGELLLPWSSFVVVPVFALANAGVRLDGDLLDRALGSPVTLGVLLGLVVGKLVGVGLAATLVVRAGWGALPPGVTLGDVWAGAALCGIGFTVSLFVADLAFTDEGLRDEATVGVLAASVIAVALGALLFRLLAARRPDTGEARPTALDPPVDPERDHLRGRPDAPLVLVEYGDLECPFCGRATGVVEDLRDRFGDDLLYVFRHLPLLDVHPHAELAAEATEAAAAQGAFWAMHDRLFAHQDALGAPDLLDHAAALGLDLERFARELGDGTHSARVRADVASAEASGARGTPTFFVNGRRHTGPSDTDALLAALLDAAPPDVPARLAPPAPAGSGVVVTPPTTFSAAADGGETPDPEGLFPRLTDAQLAPLRRAGRRRRTTTGEVLIRAGTVGYDFVVVLAGSVAIVEHDGDDARVIAVHGPGRFLGGLNMFSQQRLQRSIVVQEPGEVLTLSVDRLRAVLARERALADVVLRSFLLRRSWLIGRATAVRVIGDRRQPSAKALRAALAERGVAHQWLDPADDEAARTLLAELDPDGDGRPVALAPDGRVLVDPRVEDLDRTLSAVR